MTEYQMLIDGAEVNAISGERFETENPYNGEVWATLPRAGVDDVNRAVEAAHAAFTNGPWRTMSASERGRLLRKIADLLPTQHAKLSEIETRDNGKLIHDTRYQTAYVAQLYEYFAGLADKIEGNVVPIDRPGILTYTQYEPVGVVAVITPWNSPLPIAAGKVANALAAGCTVVIKPSEFTSASILEFVKLFEQAGFPPGVVNVVTGMGGEIGEALVTHPKVKKITFTGGTETGRHINTLAAASLKKVVLELGGKSPNIVFADADIEKAVRGAIAGIFSSSGQTCVAGSRLLLQDSIHDAFVERLLQLTSGLKLGDPFDPDTQIGPITTRPQFERVVNLLDVARKDGARCVLGGEALSGPGQLVKPTIYVDVQSGMHIAQQEVFGPVLSIIRFKDEEEAVRLANDTMYGLASGVWTSDMSRAIRMTNAIDAGCVWINMYRAASFMMPFTGHKQSGLGSENGQRNIMNYLEPKSIWINYGADITVPFLKE